VAAERILGVTSKLVSTGWVQRYVNWNGQSKGSIVVKRICGVLVLLGGLYLIYIPR
jgi:hypothetical protein